MSRNNMAPWIGMVLRGLREGKNMSQQGLAAELGLTQQTISRIEQGYMDVKLCDVLGACSYFHLSERELINSFFRSGRFEPLLNHISDPFLKAILVMKMLDKQILQPADIPRYIPISQSDLVVWEAAWMALGEEGCNG